MKVIIFGGSFNPPTRAHENIIDAALKLSGFDEIWVMPSGERIDKQYQVADKHRVRMLQLMHEEVFRGDGRLRISCFEIKDVPRPSQTWQTVAALRKDYPAYDFWFVFGADSYRDMPAWQNGRAMQAELNMLIVPRNDLAIPLTENAQLLPVVPPVMSSTEVRERTAAGQPINQLVCGSVRRYIAAHRLYRS